MLTVDCLRLLNNEQLIKKYRDCLKRLIDIIIANNRENIETILLYGGAVRDRKLFEEWSDIDIIVVFKDITKRNPVDLAKSLQQLESEYSIRIDLTQISLNELTDQRLWNCCRNSELINALLMRDDVSIVAFGRVPDVSATEEQEKEAAIFYITNTLTLLRRYIVEVAYKANADGHIKPHLKRITRWTFSIIRASLRLFNIYTHPYEYCFPYLREVFPELDISLLRRLIHIRQNIGAASITPDIIHEVEIFIEKYVTLALRRYSDEILANK